MRTAIKKVTRKGAQNGNMEGLVETVQDGLETAADHVVEGYEEATEKVHEVWDKAADTSFNDVQDSVKQYVKEYPGKCLLIAAGTGLVFGFMLRGRWS